MIALIFFIGKTARTHRGFNENLPVNLIDRLSHQKG